MNDGIVSSKPAADIGNVEFVDTAQPASARRISELGRPDTSASNEAPPQTLAQTAEQVETTHEAQPEAQPEAPPEIDYKAKYEEWLNGRTIPEELLDQMVEIPNGKDDPLVMMWRDIPGAVLRHKDYTQKTTEVAQLRRQIEQTQRAQQGWVQALAAGAPEQRLQALRAVIPEDGIKDLLRAYVQSESQLLNMPPEMQELYRQNQAAADRAATLERQLSQLREQQNYQRQEQIQQEGLNAPSIQVVLRTVEQKLPQVLAKYGLEGNEAAYDTAINMLIRSVNGARDGNGRWTIRPGVPPTDEQIEEAVSVAREELTSLAQRFVGRMPAAPTPVPSGGGPALKPGAPGNPGQPKQMRFSDLGKPVR